MSVATDLLTVSEIASRAAVTLKSIYRWGDAGKLGALTKTKNGVAYSRDAVEAFLGRKLPDAPCKPQPKLGRPPKSASGAESGLPQFKWDDVLYAARAGAELRDKIWQGYLRSRNISFETPPLSADFAPKIDFSGHFTRSQVLDLLKHCVSMRDRMWDNWRNNPLRRDAGPVPLEISARTFNLK
jgi:hypothetical protein